MKIFIKIHKTYRNVVALCDVELIGKKFEEGKRQLYLRENFYKGKEVELDEAIKILKKQSIEDATFNIVGENSIKAAIKADIINKTSIDKIKNIPFTLVLI